MTTETKDDAAVAEEAVGEESTETAKNGTETATTAETIAPADAAPADAAPADAATSNVEAVEESVVETSPKKKSAGKKDGAGKKPSKEAAKKKYERQAIEILEAPPINLKSLLNAGAHFGHQSHRWNPKMLRYIFGEKNGTHILNLDITLERWKRAEKFIEDVANRGGNILFVGTKPQAREIAREAAERVGGFSVTQRWLGGTLSNFETIKKSIHRMKKLEELLLKAEEEDSTIRLNKKERLGIRRELEKLEANLGGIRNMKHVPDMLFVIDVQREAIAVREAKKLHIPVVALVDTNVDPSDVNFPIPSNDDAQKTLTLFIKNVAAAVSRGKNAFFSRGSERQEGGKGGKGRKGGGEVQVVTKKGSGDKEKDIKGSSSIAASA